ncbi:NACHT family domain (NACHT) [Commensalibacter communis]|uniref:NACHT domain-containing protein n=1 Tax=Commensalibacter communis TaxID=2972786 RepID=UPI0022FF76F5|nr:NACHT domain-containing protein [Commensalibacter communis]CAI3940945.1 NACHT family domain (NACHT) [Commensalibacter communis]
MDITPSIVAGWAVQAGIRKVVDTSIDKAIKTKWKSIFSKGKTIVEQLSQQETYDIYLEKHLYSTMKMRTIHSADKDVLLNEIYHPLAIKDRENSLLIEDGFVYENNEIINIIGYAGQGKSTILRKIFLEALTYGKKIPFFMELRRIESDDIIKSLNLILNQLRVEAKQEDIENLLESGNILLLLDGFDEVKTEYRNQLLKEIFYLNKKYNTQIIITSRHDTEICREAGVCNFYVEPIKKTDIIAIIEKLDHYQNTDVKDYFNISEILENNQSLVETINTPLLATLFYICYPHLDSIPENTIDFYDRLFVTLYLHHDKSKNYTREKKANLDKNQAYQCFCALCFLSIYENQYDFTETSILEYMKNAVKLINIYDVSAEAIIEDFIGITSIIQRDGYNYIIFLHKSVQEYHAAQFIKFLSIDIKKTIYIQIQRHIRKSRTLYPVIKYLYNFDKNDTLNMIFIPLFKRVELYNYRENKKQIIDKFYTNIIGNLYTGIDSIYIEDKKNMNNVYGLDDYMFFPEIYKEYNTYNCLFSLFIYIKEKTNFHFNFFILNLEKYNFSADVIELCDDFTNDVNDILIRGTCKIISIKELLYHLGQDNSCKEQIGLIIDEMYAFYISGLQNLKRNNDNIMSVFKLENKM